jgi:hypothetical protein
MENSKPNAEAEADPNTDDLASNDRVIDEDDKATPPRSLSRLWKLKSEIFVFFVIGAVITFSIVFARKRSSPTAPPTTIQDEPTAPPTTIQDEPTAPPTAMSWLSIMADVIGSSFEDDFPSTTLQKRALDWLADQDPAYLAVDTDSTMLLERYTAAHFYFAMNGSNWTDHIGWLSEDPVCLWKGLNCTDQGFLARMELDENNVVGRLPSELGLLTNLVNLGLSINALTGPIPSEIGFLTGLIDLDFGLNALTGPIPSEIGFLRELTEVWFDTNALTGPIPSEFGYLTKMILLRLCKFFFSFYFVKLCYELTFVCLDDLLDFRYQRLDRSDTIRAWIPQRLDLSSVE